MERETVVIATYRHRHEAEIAQGYLRDGGLEAAILADDAGGMGIGFSFPTRARLVVLRQDERRAKELLEEAGYVGDGAQDDEAAAGDG